MGVALDASSLGRTLANGKLTFVDLFCVTQGFHYLPTGTPCKFGRNIYQASDPVHGLNKVGNTDGHTQ